MAIRSIVIYMLIVLLVTPSAMALQQPNEATMWQTFAQRLDPGTLVRVRLKDGTQIKGNYIVSSGDTMTVKPKTRIPVPVRNLQFSDIDSIDRHKDGWTPGSKVLTGVTASFGFVFLMFVAAVALISD